MMPQTEDAGFWLTEGVFTDAEYAQIIAALSATSIRRGRAGARHLMSHTAVAAVASDDRPLAIARAMLGGAAVPYRATLFEKTGRANWLVVWHQDTALPLAARFGEQGWDPWSVKDGIIYAHAPTWALRRIVALRVHLDAATSENGPLRVMPGSHAAGVLTDEEVSARAAGRDVVECLAGRGGVLAMRPLLIHSSSKARSAAPRRVLHIEYADALALASGIRLAVA